jgi:glycosyltransferase involved in cell wall biosynthesis
MRVGFFLSSESSGGGFNQNLSFILALKNKQFDNCNFIFLTDNYNLVIFLKDQNIDFLYFKKSFLRSFFLRLSNNLFFKKILKKLNIKNPFHSFLLSNNIDFLIFNSPSYYVNYSEEINYACSIWNTEIRTFNNFIEFISDNFHYQDNLIKKIVDKAFRILVFSKKNKEDLLKYYLCNQDKIIIQSLIPYLPTIYNKKKNQIDFHDLFLKLDLDTSKKWFFYPAQFWSHKNHRYVIDSLKFLDGQEHNDINFIFTGNDKGNLNYIKMLIKKNKVENRIKIFSYLKDEEIIAIYKNCFAVVIPTYVGRSSLPLLESLFFKKIIFYSKDILDYNFHDKIHAIDLNNPQDLSNKIKDCIKMNLSNKSRENLRNLYVDICSQEHLFKNYSEIIEQYIYLRKRWQDK